jgi:hypothetical protein
MDSSAYTALNCTVTAHGNNTLSNDSAATTYRIIGPASGDYDDTYVPGSLIHGRRYCGYQHLKTSLELPETTIHTNYDNIANLFAMQLEGKTRQMAMMQRKSILLAEPVYSGGAYVYGDSTENSVVLGFLNWPKIMQSELANTEVYINNSSTGTAIAVTGGQINGLVYALEDTEFADFGEKGWCLACHPVQRKYIANYLASFRQGAIRDEKTGFSVDTFVCDNGKELPIVTDWDYPKSVITVHNDSSVEYGAYKGMEMKVEKLAVTMEDVQKRKLVKKIWGTKFKKPRQNMGMIYGLPTSYSS